MRAVCENLYLFIDGGLDAVEAARFREHLSWCRRCPPALENALILDAIAEQGLSAGLRLGRTVEVAAVPPRPSPMPAMWREVEPGRLGGMRRLGGAQLFWLATGVGVAGGAIAWWLFL